MPQKASKSSPVQLTLIKCLQTSPPKALRRLLAPCFNSSRPCLVPVRLLNLLVRQRFVLPVVSALALTASGHTFSAVRPQRPASVPTLASALGLRAPPSSTETQRILPTLARDDSSPQPFCSPLALSYDSLRDLISDLLPTLARHSALKALSRLLAIVEFSLVPPSASTRKGVATPEALD
ncbi:hypothetical protein THAR02_10382 [Trichoderma harzianum]|uniref:Uncharacterized protein n=1 Tax=Trichoderma harzianum TaxID=5544 RepID=A0A0F9WYM3_TRIHA|nr:hypothetical protein THAR02_10382 [Trichoderma harzianum]